MWPLCVGDLAHILILCLAGAYMCAIFAHFAGLSSLPLFGHNWAEEGFCLSFKGTFYTTHLICLYVDTLATAVLLFLSHRAPNRPELKVATRNCTPDCDCTPDCNSR